MKDDEAPDFLRPDAGVRRLNKRPLAIVVITLGVVVFALAYGILAKSRRVHRGTRATTRHGVQTSSSAAAALVKDVPKPGPAPERPERFRSGPEAGLILPAPEAPPEADLRAAEREAEAEDRRRQTARRQQMLETALTASTRVATVDDLAARRGEGRAAGIGDPMPPGSRAGSGTATDSALARLLGGAEDPNHQAEKLKFAQDRTPMGYLPATRQSPLSEFELKAGTVIPAVLISGVNSDLPGQIVAQVTQHVYDSATGRHLLIPQGSRLVGVYDSRISLGQARVQVAWTRLNFPDASTLELGSMPGTDPGGYGGFHDRVNNHTARIFRDALLLSLISAGTQLAQPRPRGEGEISTEQQIAAALGQQFGAAGMEITRQNLKIQPTLEIRPGHRFLVMVNRDVVLTPYAEPQPQYLDRQTDDD